MQPISIAVAVVVEPNNKPKLHKCVSSSFERIFFQVNTYVAVQYFVTHAMKKEACRGGVLLKKVGHHPPSFSTSKRERKNRG